MKATQPNAEGIQALRELGEPLLRQAPSDVVLQAVASCGCIDLSLSLAAYHEAQDKAKFHRDRIKQLEKEITDLRSQLERLGNQLEAQIAKVTELEDVTPLNKSTDTITVLFSLIQDVQRAVRCARGYIKEQTKISFYYLAFLERFVLPALEGRLTPEWSADNMWADTIDTQIIQRVSLYWRDKREASWAEVFADLKKKLTPKRLQVLVGGVCTSEQCDADQIKRLIAQLRKKAKAENWPAEYMVSQ